MGRKSAEQIKKEKQTALTRDWKRQHEAKYTIYLNSTKDQQIIRKIESLPNKTEYFRQLVKQDLEREANK